jgi:hypothetical protein
VPQNEQENEQERVRATIMRLSLLCDLVGLEAQIEHKTKYGKRPGPEPWTYTREYLAYYAEQTDPEEVIGLFESVGCHNDIEAVRWLLKHDELVP